MSSVKETLESRGETYGDYKGGSEFRAIMMKAVNDRFQQVHGHKMPGVEQIYIFDIINKLSRLAVTPNHIDSWHDIQGYAKLVEEALNEQS